MMHEQNENINRSKKYKKEPNVENNYNDWIKKIYYTDSTSDLIKQKKESANLSHLKVSRVSIRGKKKKKTMKKR